MKSWFGWLIEQSLDDQSIFGVYPTVKMKSEAEDWKEHIIEVPEEKVKYVISWLEEHIKPSWYAHLVNQDQMIVVYKDKHFLVKKGKSYKEIHEYGKSAGIIEEQLPGEDLFELARKSGF